MPYNAFISYSHTADATIAAALQSALHSFAKPWYKLRALHVFRDQTNLAVNPALWSSIREALDQSLFFILLASPEAAASPWVAKEAEYWIGRNGVSHVLLVVTGGTLEWDRSAGCFTPERATALPPNLLRSFSEEPLFLDLRWARDGSTRLRLREPRFHEAVLQLASTLHNRPKDELDGADIRTQRHARWLAASVLFVILAIAFFAWRQTGANRIISTENAAANLAANSSKVLADSADRAAEAALLAVESTRLKPTFEGTQALRAAVALLPAAAQTYAPEDSDPDERIRDMAFSSNGATLAVVRDNGSTQLIDVANHKAIGYIGPDEQPAARIQITGVTEDPTPDNDPAVSVAFNADASLLASAGRDGVAHVWALPAGREVLRVVHGAALSQVAFRPAANEVITAGDDGHVRIFDVARAAAVADFRCPDKVVSAAFTPGGNLIAALSSDGDVSIFDVAQRKLLRTVGGGEAAFNLAFSGDGKRVAAADGDFAFVWDVATGQQLLKATHAGSSETLIPGRWIVAAAISPDGKFLAYAAKGDKFAHVWNVDTGRQVLQLQHDSAAAAVAFNADGTRLGTGSYDGTARVWELPSGNELERVSHGGGAEVVTFTRDGRFASGGMDGSVSVSETRRADRPVFFDLPGDVRSVAFSPDGRRVAIGSVSVHASPFVRIADIGGNTVRDIEFHGAPVIDKLFFVSPNQVIAQWSDKLFLIGVDQASVTPLPDIHGDKRIEPSGKVLAVQQDGVSNLYTLPGQQQTTSLATPGSKLLRTAADGKLAVFEVDQPPNKTFVDIWNVAGKARVSRIALAADLNRIAIDPPGNVAFTAESEKLQAWEISSGKERFHLTASDDIESIVPSAASDAVATITHGRLVIWDAVSGVRIGQLPDTGSYIRAAAFSPDGRYLLTGYDERSAALWLWRASDLRDQACARLTRNLSREEWGRWFPGQPYRQSCPNLPAGK